MYFCKCRALKLSNCWMLYRTFPRLREVDKFYLCTKAQGTSRHITIQHYSTPSAPVLKVKLFLILPNFDCLTYNFFLQAFKWETSGFGPNKEILGLRIIRRRGGRGGGLRFVWKSDPNPQLGAPHWQMYGERFPVSKKKDLLNPWNCNSRFKFISISKTVRTIF